MPSMVNLLLIVWVLVIFASIALAESDVTVISRSGVFIGKSENIDTYAVNVTVTKFLGIPYAEPPVGNLRFRKPVAKKPFTAPYNADQIGPPCFQVYSTESANTKHSEDCLFLNIYKPEVKHRQGLPVMVWVHGGGFLAGSADKYSGEVLAANGPVIVVTLNYRLSVYGFLNPEDPSQPANLGLWDQHLAIQWVHENIASFGGDTDRVTLFGESAGGTSVIYHGIFPESRGQFQRIIAESGSALSPWALRSNPRVDALKLASLVGCDNEDTAKMVDCLRGVPSTKLNAAVSDRNEWGYQMPFPFTPSVDGQFIAAAPIDIFRDKDSIRPDLLQLFSSFDLLMGYNSGEGRSAMHPAVMSIDGDLENFLPNKTYFDETLVPRLVTTTFGHYAPPILADVLAGEYTDWDDPDSPRAIRQKVCKMLSDWMMAGSTYRTIQSHSTQTGSKSYLYYFDILPYMSIIPRPSWFNRPTHLDELLYVFGNKVYEGKPRELQLWEHIASQHIISLWTNFAKTGNPNQPNDFGLGWLTYDRRTRSYLEISNDVTSSKMKHRLNERAALFWDSILPGIYLAANSGDKSCFKDSCSKNTNVPP